MGLAVNTGRSGLGRNGTGCKYREEWAREEWDWL